MYAHINKINGISDRQHRMLQVVTHQNGIKVVPRGAGTSLCGGALPLEDAIVLGLSRMTLTRDLARTVLLAQIYRAFTILRGYPYPR